MPSNDYFDNSTEDALPKGATARAESVDAKFNSITAGLDKLPTQAENNAGIRNYAGTSGGAAGAYTASLTHVTVLVDGQELELIANHSNPSGGVTVNLSAIGATIAVLADGSALPANAIIEDGTYRFKYNATLAKWVLNTGAATALSTGTAATTSLADAGSKYNAEDVEAALAELTSNVNGEGASILGIEDVSGRYSATNIEGALIEAATSNELISTANGEGASLSGVEDAGGYFDGDDLEDVTQELGASLGGLNIKSIDIGDWDMDANVSKIVVHNIASGNSKIRAVIISIRNDAGTTTYDFNALNNNETSDRLITWDDIDFLLIRPDLGEFDNVNFDSTSYNRGWITILYTD